jgi:hypothetical protein
MQIGSWSTLSDTALPQAVIEARIRTALRDINGSFDGSLEPVRRGQGSHATASAFPPLPVSAHVLDVRARACGRLATWARIVAYAQDLHPAMSRSDVPALTHLLTIHAALISTLASGETCMDQLEASARDLAAISTTTDPGTLLGTCPLVTATDGTAAVCGGQVRSLNGVGTCSRCGTSGETPWWEHHMFPDTSRLVTAQQLCHEIHQQRGQRVRVSTISTWLNRGWIVSAGLDQDGRRLYDKGAVAKALATHECA